MNGKLCPSAQRWLEVLGGGAIDSPLIGFEAHFHRKMEEAPHLELWAWVIIQVWEVVGPSGELITDG